MDIPISYHYASQNESSFMKELSFLTQFPDRFRLVSSMTKSFNIDPKLAHEDVIKRFKGFKDINCVMYQHGGVHYWMIADTESEFLYFDFNPGHFNLTLFSSTMSAKQRMLDFVKLLKDIEFKNTSKDGVWARFSYYTQEGIRTPTQFLKCPTWDEIRMNYPEHSLKPLDWLFKLEDPKKHGHLLIWHGAPGTGKTYAIRALMMAWKDKFNFVIVTDPENLSARSEYYYGVCSSDDDEGVGYDHEKKTLFIMEDSADLIIEQSRSLHYDKIGKLLNMTDGLLGQGREDLFMITFNENIDKIDPAFVRPGRCIMHHKFERFRQNEADSWLSRNKAMAKQGTKFIDGASLAELYELLLKSRG